MQYSLVGFPDKTHSMVPQKWFIDKDIIKWPHKSKTIRTMLLRAEDPKYDWKKYTVRVLAKNLSYQRALKMEKELSEVSETASDYSTDFENKENNLPDFNNLWVDNNIIQGACHDQLTISDTGTKDKPSVNRFSFKQVRRGKKKIIKPRPLKKIVTNRRTYTNTTCTSKDNIAAQKTSCTDKDNSTKNQTDILSMPENHSDSTPVNNTEYDAARENSYTEDSTVTKMNNLDININVLELDGQDTTINYKNIVDWLKKNQEEQEKLGSALISVKETLVDLTSKVQSLQGKKCVQRQYTAYDSVNKLQELENNLKSSKENQKTFYMQLQTIHELNKHVIGANIDEFYKFCLNSLFTKSLLTQLVWKKSRCNGKYSVGATQVFAQIHNYGSIINENSLEQDRIKILGKRFNKATDNARKKMKIGKYR